MSAVESWDELGSRVAEARLAAGLSQGQVATELGIDRTAVVRLESGERHVGALELGRLAGLLGVPLAHFLTRPPATVVSRRAELTADSDQASRTRYQLDAALEAHARDAQWLTQHAGLPTMDDGTFQRLRRVSDNPARLAAEARGVLGAPSGPLGPLVDAVEQFGLYLTVVDVDAEGASLIDGEIGVSVIGGHAQPGRRRWTAAHELGHHLSQDEYHSDAGVAASRDEREQRIDRFVGEFLIPTADLTERWNRRPGGRSDRDVLIGLAGDYRLSWSAAVKRSVEAGPLPPDPARRLKVDPPTRGDFLAVLGTEPTPDLVMGAVGRLWKQAALRAWRDCLVTGPRVIELLHGTLEADELPERPGPVA